MLERQIDYRDEWNCLKLGRKYNIAQGLHLGKLDHKANVVKEFFDQDSQQQNPRQVPHRFHTESRGNQPVQSRHYHISRQEIQSAIRYQVEMDTQIVHSLEAEEQAKGHYRSF